MLPPQLADKVSKLRYRPLRSQGYFSFSPSSPYNGKAEGENGKSKRRVEYLDDIPLAKNDFELLITLLHLIDRLR